MGSKNVKTVLCCTGNSYVSETHKTHSLLISPHTPSLPLGGQHRNAPHPSAGCILFIKINSFKNYLRSAYSNIVMITLRRFRDNAPKLSPDLACTEVQPFGIKRSSKSLAAPQIIPFRGMNVKSSIWEIFQDQQLPSGVRHREQHNHRAQISLGSG